MRLSDYKSLTFSYYFCLDMENYMSTPEGQFQARLVKRLEKMFPGCFIERGDPNYCQGAPDLTIFYKNKWAKLECKKSSKAPHRPNQDYYVEKFNRMSFASFIYPENEEEVLHELQQAFGV